MHILAWVLAIFITFAWWVSLAWILAVFWVYAWQVHTLAKASTGRNAYGSVVLSFVTCVLALWLVHG